MTVAALFCPKRGRVLAPDRAAPRYQINNLGMVPRERIELPTSPLPRVRCTGAKRQKPNIFCRRAATHLPPNSQSPVRLNTTPPSYWGEEWKRDCA